MLTIETMCQKRNFHKKLSCFDESRSVPVSHHNPYKISTYEAILICLQAVEDFPPPFHTQKEDATARSLPQEAEKKQLALLPHILGGLKKKERRVFFFFPVCQFECCRLDREREEGGTVGARQPRFCAKKREEWITLFVQRRGKGRRCLTE